MNHARVWTTLLGISASMALPACSTDRTGLGQLDVHGSGGDAGVDESSSGGHMGGGPGSGGRDGSGGTATGGRATGGSGGTATGRGTGGAPVARPACTTAADCRLYSDCCTCEARPVNAPIPPGCPLLCIQSRCAQHQLPVGAVDCVAGRCVAGFNCDDSRVTCDIPTPTCPAGEVPAVNPAGTCYAGGCVPASQCRSVANCGACGAALACVTYQTQLGNQSHCVTIPGECSGGGAPCGCLGPTACVAPYGSCSDVGVRGLVCSCPNC